MGIRRLTKVKLAVIVVILGAAALVAGISGLFGVWWGLISGGSLAVIGGLTLIRVDEPGDHTEGRRR